MKNYLNPLTFILLVLGIMFKIMHWPGANFMVIISSVMMLISAFFAYRENTEMELSKSMNAIMLLTVVFLILGSMFRFMHWPGKNMIGTIAYGLILLTCGLLAFSNRHFSIGKGYLTVLTFLFLFVLLNFPRNPLVLLTGNEYTVSEQMTNDHSSQDSTLHQEVHP